MSGTTENIQQKVVTADGIEETTELTLTSQYFKYIIAVTVAIIVAALTLYSMINPRSNSMEFAILVIIIATFLYNLFSWLSQRVYMM
jgi:hypothetical protein